MSAPMPPTHHVELTHDDLRALLIAVDHAVYRGPDDATRFEPRVYKELTVLHERLWKEFSKP